MTRLGSKAEIFKNISKAYVVRESTGTHGDSTVASSAIAAGDTSFDVADATNFADGDYIRIGTGNTVELNRVDGAPAGNTITVRSPVAFAHAVGETVVEVTRTDLGHITDEGLRSTISGDTGPVGSGTRRLVVTYNDGHAELIAEVDLEGVNLENLATALGIAESSIDGAGTEADPYRLILDPENFGSEDDVCFHFTGVLSNGDIVLWEFWGCEVDWTAVNTAMNRASGTPPALPLRARAVAGAAVQIYTAA